MQTIDTLPSQAVPPEMPQSPPQQIPSPPQPYVPAQTTPMPPIQSVVPTPVQQQWQPAPATPVQATSRHIEHRALSQAAGVPVWGVLLILVGAIALFGNLGIGLGWIFGLALGSWFVYLGVRNMQNGAPINWWLVGLGLLIGLGAVSVGFLDKLVFPMVLVFVGLGIISEYWVSSRNRSQNH